MPVIPYIIITLIGLASYISRKLTLWASLTAIIVGIFIFWGAGYTGLAMLGAFFILGVIATGWRKHDKEQLKPTPDRGNCRNAAQVLANGGVAAICGVMIIIPALTPHLQTFRLMMTGSLAAAIADTLSSELGIIYGRRFYNVVNFRPDTRGLDGVISVEGTFIGIVGSALIALIYSWRFGFLTNFWIIIVAGTLGNYVDSLLGATLECKSILNNNIVNFCNTLTGALIAFILANIN